MKDVYYNPERFGLAIYCEWEEPDLDWEFNMKVVWKAIDAERYYYAEDSGCSCPSPFEDYTNISALEVISRDKADEYKKEWR